ncbi:hypothetical protein [Methyloversatilis thermotolerans]|nr:hypothetical protein [Methyloversatilis thermotolerans]
MWLFLLEAGTALALFIFILWWTLPKKDPARPAEPDHEKKDDHGQH